VKILPAIALIGVTTAIFSGAGVFIGKMFGSSFKSKAEFVGGIILIGIGIKILLEHTLCA
jgi:putative Mn2+ efflux pump MntP